MAESKSAPFGTWKSPIGATQVATTKGSFDQISVSGNAVYWVESRPEENGRQVLVRAVGETVTDVTPAPYNCRTRAHEYGGLAYVVAGDTIFFSHYQDHRLYVIRPGAEPVALTPENGMRYADPIFDSLRNRVICVAEDHSGNGEPVNKIVTVSVDSGAVETFVDGKDFFAWPRLSPDGTKFAWISWNHPNMPWDGCELYLAQIYPDGKLGSRDKVAGSATESIVQPEWSPTGVLHFISDRTGWWNLYRSRGGEIADCLHQMEADFGKPQWQFGQTTYGFLGPNQIIATFSEKGVWRMGVIDANARRFQKLDSNYSEFKQIKATANAIVFIGASPRDPWTIVRFDLQRRRNQIVRRSGELDLEPEYISEPITLEYPTRDGATAYGFFYKPKNRDHAGGPNEKAPLMVISHGGPTAAAMSAFSLPVQFWTSRGFAVLDVNYRGSTGFGKAYREKLYGNWGILDVEDCIDGVKHLADTNQIDPNRVMIRGGSAGGFTTLAALTFHRTFKAGASYFGVSDIETLAKETHKFESRYPIKLIGPYPERKDIYHDRSPIHFTDKLDSPLILFQGLDDRIVPPNQSEMMFVALKSKGVPVAYITFEGEAHGFRKSDSIRKALDSELYFYSRVFRFELPEPAERIFIENLTT